jgi:hypothetical protein
LVSLNMAFYLLYLLINYFNYNSSKKNYLFIINYKIINIIKLYQIYNIYKIIHYDINK